MATWTVEQCDAKIAEFESALDELALLPTRTTTGKTSVDLSGKSAEIQERLETWRQRRSALLNGGRAPRLERCC